MRASPLAATLRRTADGFAALTGWRRFAVAVLLGAMATLAMPPVGAVPVLLLVFPPFIWLLRGTGRRWAAFWTGWAFSFGFFVFGLYWVAFALTVDLERFGWMIPFAVCGLPALLALFAGTAIWCLQRLNLTGTAHTMAFAGLWALAEWLRGHVLTGFPWNLIGYAWVDWTPVIQATAWIGIYGLSMVTVLAAAAPAAAVDRDGRWSRPALAVWLAACTALAGFAIAGTLRLSDASDDTVPGIMLRLVQPNIAQADKWRPELGPQHLTNQMELSLLESDPPITHVIWPETAIPYLIERDVAVQQAIGSIVPPGGLALVGAPRASAPGEPQQYWNSLQVVRENGSIAATFDKFHLVPFGEYMPLRDWLPLDSIAAGSTDYSSGPGPRTLALDGLPPFSPLICYEAIFPGAVIDRSDRPQWLVNVTNDAWYGHTAGPHQHFAIAQVRAVEEGLPMARVATTGVSGVIDAYGRVTASLDLGRRGVVDAPLPVALPQPTLYARIGDTAFWVLCVLCLAAPLTARRRSADATAEESPHC